MHVTGTMIVMFVTIATLRQNGFSNGCKNFRIDRHRYCAMLSNLLLGVERGTRFSVSDTACYLLLRVVKKGEGAYSS